MKIPTIRGVLLNIYSDLEEKDRLELEDKLEGIKLAKLQVSKCSICDIEFENFQLLKLQQGIAKVNMLGKEYLLNYTFNLCKKCIKVYFKK